jgi:GNAT superfamily N-acetyltransferase
MQIVAYQSHMAAELARCYDELVAAVPYHHPAVEEWFAGSMPAQLQDCTEEQMLVARDGGEVVGFVHVGISAPPTHKWHVKGEPGVVRFLSCRPGERATGVALLEAAERWLREHGRTEVVAGFGGYMYAFYPLPMGHISERISHLPPLLAMAGYAIPESEVFFHWPSFEPPQVSGPDLPFELTSEQAQVAASQLEVKVHARQGERQVGECKMLSLRGDPWRPQLADWCICTNLYVDEPLRRRGLGRYLLAAGLAEMRRAGCRHAMISTDWDNYPACLLYTNVGYRFLDRTFGFSKSLG